jgi:hypothetical protein
MFTAAQNSAFAFVSHVAQHGCALRIDILCCATLVLQALNDRRRGLPESGNPPTEHIHVAGSTLPMARA